MASIPTATPLAEVQVLRKSSSGAQRAPGHEQQQQQQQVPLDGRGAGFRAQAGALYRKNAVFQRRNWCSNVCLLSAPIFFCLMLFGIQIAINKLLLTGDDYAVSRGVWRAVGDKGAAVCSCVRPGRLA